MQRNFFLVPLLFLYFIYCASSEENAKQENPSVMTTEEVGGKATDKKGCVAGDCVNGFGKYIYDTGDIYEGEFKNGLRNGKGRMMYTNGDVFEGIYKDDLRDGEGVYIFKNGDKYHGSFRAGNREGKGVYEFHDGMIFEGNFINDGVSGNGMLKIEDKVYENCSLKERKVFCETALP